MESLNFIDNNNIPINIHAIQRNYIQNGSEIKKIMYPHSVVINESKTINKDINYLENFKNIELVYNSKSEEFQNNTNSPIIAIYSVNNFYEMDPRPGFRVNTSGIWSANSLLQMEPYSKIDQQIREDIENL
jgi:hypothetical protein